jgi:hypothetical protein
MSDSEREVVTTGLTIQDLKDVLKYKEKEALELMEYRVDEERDKLRVMNILEEEIDRKESEIDRLHGVILTMDDEADDLKELNTTKDNIIANKDEIIMNLRGIIHEILLKDNKDAEYLSDLFDKDIEAYEDEILAAYE